MKKLISLMLALMLVLSLSTVAFAAEPTYTDMSRVTLTKEYTLTNSGTTSPAETFTFSALTCTGVKDAADGVTTANAPVPTIGSVSYEKGEAGSATARKNITITLPNTYTSVGVYTYTFTENDGNTAGVTYRSDAITLVVTVVEQNGQKRVAAVHTEEANGAKSGTFNNAYSAGSLLVKKTVTGNLGDQTKPFNVTVKFTAPEGKTVGESISYTDDGVGKTIATTDWENGVASADITLKHDETVTFTNIPYGVTYTVEEDDYTSDGYKAAAYAYDDSNKKIDSVSENVTITNEKSVTVDTGITLDSLPFVLILAVCAGAVVLFVIKRRNSAEF